jgi:hypothetical protein
VAALGEKVFLIFVDLVLLNISRLLKVASKRQRVPRGGSYVTALLVLSGAPPPELKSVIVNSKEVRFGRSPLLSETELTVQSGFPPS